MPVKTGLEAAREIGDKAHIVFITAYDQYAIEAFDQGAVDYVLKPADIERLGRTVQRLKLRLANSTGSTAKPLDMNAMLTQLASQMGIAAKPAFLQWIQASIGQELRLIPVDEILFFQSDEKYTRVQTVGYEALIRKPVRDLSEELDPALFWQIHRSTLVNAKAISGVVRDMRGRHLVQIKGLTEKLEVSRSFVHLFKQM
jgi:DNA-binding LytR/AlgR family response regulator